MGSIAGDERRGESERRDAADEPEDNELPGDNDIDFHAEWSDTYKVACQCLYGSDEKKPDFKEAFRLFSGEAEEGNALAMFDLGRMYADGLGREADPAKAHEWYGKALTAFVAAEQCAEERQRPYLQYRIGKMYAAGLGYELPVVPDEEGGDGKAVRDYEKAVAWLEKAAEAEHASAQYALANIYLAGEAVAKDVTKATELFTRAAKQGHDYAAYQLGKQFLQGEETEKDVEAAIKWLKQSAAANNQYAQYSLGKLYLDGEDVEKDIRTAITYLKKSAAQNNAFAEYRLGRFYLLGEDVEADVKEAVQWLEQSASQGNQYAQYALGKLYLCGHEVPRNKEKALPYLEASAAQGNIYAQFLLDHLDSFYEPSVFLATTRLMHRLAQMFEEEKWKAGGSSMQVEGKLRSRIREKKKAMGHKSDDETPCQNLS